MSKQDEMEMIPENEKVGKAVEGDLDSKDDDFVDGFIDSTHVRWMSQAYLKFRKIEPTKKMEEFGKEFENLKDINEMPDFIKKCAEYLRSGNATSDEKRIFCDLDFNFYTIENWSDKEVKDWLIRYSISMKRNNLIERLANATSAPSSKRFVEGIDIDNIEDDEDEESEVDDDDNETEAND